ncbi:MAG: T9SS type A sorting domain-containing protein [candidate division WOR-3 bacterium]
MLGPRTVNDPPPGGNGNGRFDPGETGGLLLALRNVGNEEAANVSCLLRSADSRFVLTDSTSTYGTIPACSTRLGDPFAVSVGSSIPPETPVQLTAFITGTSYVDTLRFTLTVGELRACDPIPDGPRTPAHFWAYDDVDTLYAAHPDFNWVEVRGLGTQLALSDDQTVQLDLPSGFVWQFYGQQYTQVSICGNGWVAPGYTTTTTYLNTSLPNTSMPPAVFLNWDDLYPPDGGGVWYYHDATNHRFIVEWDSVRYYSGTLYDKFQLVIHDTSYHTPTGDNILLVQYLTANGYTSSTLGIQDPSATIAIQCLFDNSYHRGTAPLQPGRAIKYCDLEPQTGLAENANPIPGLHRTLIASPNPFRTSVALSLPGISATQARIYDNSGRLVRTLTGNSRWNWDGRDEVGRRIAFGVYFCRVTTETGEARIKLILE